MRFVSLFSGIEAASCAWVPLGWSCMAVPVMRWIGERMAEVDALGIAS